MKRIENEIAYLKKINNDTAKRYIDFLKSLEKTGDEYVTSKDCNLIKEFEDEYSLNLHHDNKVMFRDEYMLGDFIELMNETPSIFYATESMFDDDEDEYYM